jgi:glycosyltransferase involved in cell wall biosynthesis
MKLSVIITTYNSKEWLKKVLLGYSFQTERNFEIVIADDGSTETTKELIDTFKNKFKFPIIHVWQEDKGFRKSKILNKAILKTNSDYLIFTDGDCIPRNDFVATHLKHKEQGYFLSGGYFKLPLSISTYISENDIENQKCFSIRWLLRERLSINFKISKLLKTKLIASFLNWITPTKRTFNGHNSSAFKSDILKVNGFNEEMQYGGLDRELGERLLNNGIMSKQIRYSAICLHLEHERNYASQETWAANNVIREYNKKNKITYIKKGIDQYSFKND